MANRRTLLIFIFFNCLVQFVLPQCSNFTSGPPERLVITDGGSTSLYCQHKDFRAVDWYKGMSAIAIGADRRSECSCNTETDVRGGVEIHFTDFQAEDAGTYGCWAQISAGEFDICNFEVVVAVAPTVQLPSLIVVENTDDPLVILPNISLGIPEANITWSKNGVLLDPDTNVRVSVNDVTGVLMLTGFRREDRGEYTIMLSNQAGPVSVTVPVTINFVQVSVSSSPVTNSDGAKTGYSLRCEGTGFPSVPIQWVNIRDSGFDANIPNGYEVTNTSETIIPIAECMMVYMCSVTLSIEGRTIFDSMAITPCTSGVDPPSDVNLALVGTDGVMVTWQLVTNGATGYRVQYYLTGGSVDQADIMDYGSDSSSASITSLIPGEYSFRVGTLHSGGDPVYSTSQTFTVPCSNTPVPTEEVADVSADLVSSGGMRTITVTWNLLPDAYGYRLSISPPPFSAFSPMILTTTNSYMLPTSSCDGTSYTFTVEVVNNCMMGGPSVSVQQMCSTFTAVGVTLDIDVYQTHLDLNIGLPDPSSTPNPNTRITVNATNLIPFPESGLIITSTYLIVSYPSNGNICIKGLVGATNYNVCVDTAFLNGQDANMVICKSIITSIDGGLSPDSQCRMPDKSFTETASAGGATFPEWAIAVIVVSFLAMVALVFCFIGLFFACNSGKSKENIYGSASSLQASSIPPGMGMQTHHNQNHSRDVSPPGRSCLSYHSKGHSTNWNEHSNTLRQMDTAKGTNV